MGKMEQWLNMKIISLAQPYATLIDIKAKSFETRSWSPGSYRGPVAIHAAKGLGPVGGRRGLNEICSREPFRSVLRQHFRQVRGLHESAPAPIEGPFGDFHLWLPFGEILCVGELVKCLNTSISLDSRRPPQPSAWMAELNAQEMAFGDYSPGRVAWQFENVRSLIPVLQYKGAQGLRDLPVEVEADILCRLT